MMLLLVVLVLVLAAVCGGCTERRESLHAAN
jgi:hypothetical protein